MVDEDKRGAGPLPADLPGVRPELPDDPVVIAGGLAGHGLLLRLSVQPCRYRPAGSPGIAAVAGQCTADRLNTRIDTAVASTAQPASTSRLRAASAVLLPMPQMSCRLVLPCPSTP